MVAEQAAERMATAAASAKAAAERATASAAAVAMADTASTFRSTEAMPPASVQAVQPAPAADFSLFETTPTVAAVTEAYMATQECTHCSERRPLYKSASGGYVCGFHRAMALSLLDAPSVDGTSGRAGGNGESGVRAAATPARQAGTPGSKCILFDVCENMVTVPTSGSRCSSGHALCADCTVQYLEVTLLPGTVWWDRIKCVDPECKAHMQGMSVQRCISPDLRRRIDAAQLEVVPAIGPEARRERERAEEAAQREADQAARREEDRASEATVASTTKPCPNCGVPTWKDGGCRHMACKRCKQDYYWECHCPYPGHHVSCVPR